MLKKIFVYVGSRNENSRIFDLTNQIISRFKNLCSKEIELQIDIYSPLNTQLNPSTGCRQCFNLGQCPSELKDEPDDGELIKRKMKEADYIILASPVYSHNVSSDMKVLVDRLSYWAHLYTLVKKAGIVISTAESNGATFVTDYLEKTLSFMGASVIHKTNFIKTESFLADTYVEETVDSMLHVLDSSYKFTPTDYQETTFNTLKIILSQYEQQHFEHKYWVENHLFDCDTLEEYFESYA